MLPLEIVVYDHTIAKQHEYSISCAFDGSYHNILQTRLKQAIFTGWIAVEAWLA